MFLVTEPVLNSVLFPSLSSLFFSWCGRTERHTSSFPASYSFQWSPDAWLNRALWYFLLFFVSFVRPRIKLSHPLLVRYFYLLSLCSFMHLDSSSSSPSVSSIYVFFGVIHKGYRVKVIQRSQETIQLKGFVPICRIFSKSPSHP